MPRTTTARTLPKAPAYLDIRLASDSFSETNDCAVCAVAFAADIAYAEAHRLLKAKGRQDRTGTPRYMTLSVLRDLGYRVTEIPQTTITSRYPGKHAAKQQVTPNQPDRFPAAWRDGKTYLMCVKGHILCVKNGVNLDWSRGRVMPANALFLVERA